MRTLMEASISDSDSGSDTEDAGIEALQQGSRKRSAEECPEDNTEVQRQRGLQDVGRVKVSRSAPPIAPDSGLTAGAVAEVAETVRQQAEEDAITLEAAEAVVRRKRESAREERERLAREERESYEAEVREHLDAQRRTCDFILHFEDTTMLLNIIKVIEPLVKDGIFDVNSECLSVAGMDSSQVSFVSMRLDKDQFLYFYVSRIMSFGMHIDSLVKVLKANQSSEVQIMQRIESDYIEVNFLSDGKFSKWEIATLDIDQDNRDIPEFRADVSAVVDPSLLTQEVKACKVAGDAVRFEFFPDMLQMSVRERAAERMCTTSIKVSPGSFVYIEDSTNPHGVACGKGAMTELAIMYLEHFVKAESFSSAVVLKQTHENESVTGPMIFEYPIDDERESFVRFIIAPRILEE